jgi:hypothetical protein
LLLAFLYAFIWLALPLYLGFFVPGTSGGEYVIYRERFWSALGIIVGWVWLQSLRELPRY